LKHMMRSRHSTLVKGGGSSSKKGSPLGLALGESGIEKWVEDLTNESTNEVGKPVGKEQIFSRLKKRKREGIKEKSGVTGRGAWKGLRTRRARPRKVSLHQGPEHMVTRWREKV